MSSLGRGDLKEGECRVTLSRGKRDDHIEAQGWPQAEAATRLGVTQPRISDLVRGKFNLFGLDHLAIMLARAGRQVEIRVKKAGPGKKPA